MRENLPPFLRKTDRRKWGIWGFPREFPGNSRFSGVDRGTGNGNYDEKIVGQNTDGSPGIWGIPGEFPGNSRDRGFDTGTGKRENATKLPYDLIEGCDNLL